MNRNESLFNRAKAIIPGGVNSPVRIRQRRRRTALYQKAEGAYVWDENGTRYTDYVGSWGPAIVGHAHPEVIEAVREAALGGLSFGAPTEGEIVIAEEIAKIMPSVEQLRLVSSGTEATMTAIRLARGFTGRDKIIKFEGCYHGHSEQPVGESRQRSADVWQPFFRRCACRLYQTHFGTPNTTISPNWKKPLPKAAMTLPV